MKQLCRAISVLIAAIVLAALAAPVDAQAFLYAGKRKHINCGVVWTEVNPVDRSTPPLNQSVTAGLDASGYPVASGGVGDLFYLLDMRTDLKPPGWSFDNPMAPGGPATGLSKANPVYWQVDLQSASDLSRMHVLYLPAHGTLKLSLQDREKLRRFVDGGGVLWIDNGGAGGQLDFDDTFFILNFKFLGVTGSDFPFSRHHPLLTLPFWLNDWDIANLGANPGSAVCIPGYDPGAVGGWAAVSEQPISFDVLYPVVGNTNGSGKPSAAANAYGSGRVVATSTYAGRGCYFGAASLKFAYNVVAWSSSWTHLRKDPRHSGASIDTVGGTKLLEVWSLPVPATGGGSDSATGYAPVIYKNIVFYSAGSTLYALDLVPQEDLDHDGNPDDGFPGVGSMTDDGQDVVWTFPSPGGILSAPSIVTAQDPKNPGASIEVVLVAAASGDVYMLPAFPVEPPGRFVQDPAKIAPFLTWNTGSPNPNPGPPLYVNGWLFATGGDGRLYAYNPSLENWGAAKNETVYATWCVPTDSPGLVEGSAEPRTGPSFGYVTSDSSGATVGMVYWFAGPWVTTVPVAGAEQNDHVYGVPVQVCNDRVRVDRVSPSGFFAECRITYNRAFVSKVPEPVAFLRNAGPADTKATRVYRNVGLNGDSPPNEDNPSTRKIGRVVVESATAITPNTMIHVTYALDYASPEGINYTFTPNTRQPLEPRSNSQNGVPKTTVVSMPAMGPDNMIFLAGKREGNNTPPALYGLSSDGTTQLSRWIYLLHSGVDPALLSGHLGVEMPIPGVVYNTGSGRWMQNPKQYSSPAVWQDKVFVTVSGDTVSGPGGPDTGTPTAALLCFKADSDFVIRITESAGRDAGGGSVKKPKRLRDPVTGHTKQVMLWQPNLMEGPSAAPGLPLQMARLARPDMGVSVDYDKGTLTFNHFDKMRLMGGALNLQVTNCFSPSLPVYAFVDNVEVPIDWNTWGPTKAVWLHDNPSLAFPAAAGDSVDLSGWNNLLWFYMVPAHTIPGSDPPQTVPCSGIHSSPVVIGSNVYFVCDDGYIYAYPAAPGETSGGPADPKLLVWEGTIVDDMGAPSARGPLGQQQTGWQSLSIAGSNGVLLIPTAGGLHAYTNATTLVADANRLVETDGAGEIGWSLSSVSWPVSAPQGSTPAMTSGPVNKPSRAKYLPSGEMLVVNSGSNQVCRIDKSGTAGLGGLLGKYIRGVYDKFVDPKNLLRPGQPTALSSPTDALFWQDYEKEGNVTMRVDHCAIADSGNHRVLDLVYKFNLDSNGTPTTLAPTPGEQPDPATGFYLPELNWVTVTDSTNERYVYDCLQLVLNADGSQDMYAAVSNYRGNVPPPGPKVESQGLGGAIFALRYRVPRSGGAGWDYATSDAGRIVAACDRIVDPTGNTVPLASPRFFQAIDRPAKPPFMGGRFILICDNYGVYEVGPVGIGDPPIRRALRDEDYRGMLREMKDFGDGSIAGEKEIGVPLVASSVQELMNGNWLITNNYSGSSSVGAKSFAGEVFEISWNETAPATHMYTLGRVEWSSPPLYVLTQPNPNPPGGKDILWDTWKQRLENSYIFQQPRSAVRQM